MSRVRTSSAPEVLVPLDRTSAEPLHRQLEQGLRDAIRNGRLGRRIGRAVDARVRRRTRRLARDRRRGVRPARGRGLPDEPARRRDPGRPERPRPPGRGGRRSCRRPTSSTSGRAGPTWTSSRARSGCARSGARSNEAPERAARLPRRPRRTGTAGRAGGLPRPRPRHRGGPGVDRHLLGVLAGTEAGRRRPACARRAPGRDRGSDPAREPMPTCSPSATRSSTCRSTTPGSGSTVLDGADVDLVIVTAAHQYPTGAVLSPERRAALVAWAERRDGIIIEDDYDAEYRYDREPIGAIQGLSPDHVVYAGSASKTLAPGLRLGWLLVPESLADGVARAKQVADLGSPAIDQLAFADFIRHGELDRHLRRLRVTYRARRDRLLEALDAPPAGLPARRGVGRPARPGLAAAGPRRERDRRVGQGGGRPCPGDRTKVRPDRRRPAASSSATDSCRRGGSTPASRAWRRWW